ncbi:glycosyltransferase [Microaerobacter geothermalis]|uniref:glycosyltransferase n=1 Tax=Microaerobacter geothermalis TaxID=674972 RepID=UPI001F2DC286|nr:glycosyltransferase [Microaerobacter geothermalis]MCF6092560.1 glycosyltransferase [Microaerobacter geothermalis]
MSNPRKVLMISYLFPPIGGGGVQRALKMAKYLPQYGWQVHVLTVDSPAHVSLDHSLLQQLPEGTMVHRASERGVGKGSNIPGGKADFVSSQDRQLSSNKHPGSNKGWKKEFIRIAKPYLKKAKEGLLIPDDQILWYSDAVKKGLDVIYSHDIDVIFSTSGPYTNHLVGLALKNKTGKPWIADFRDPWTQNMHQSDIPWKKWIEETMERRVMNTSDVVLTVTPSFARNFKKKHPGIKNLQVIYNGFDPEDYDKITPIDTRGLFTASYAGIFYKERNPRLFLEAVYELIQEGLVDRKHLSCKFAGVFDYPGYSENYDCVKQLGLEDVVEVLGHLPHHEVLSLLKGSNLLLLIGDTAPGSGDYIPGKLFEYMAIGNPILALTVPGESERIIREYGLGEVVNPFSQKEIKQAYLRMYQLWVNGNGYGETERSFKKDINIYNRKYQAEQLAEVMETLI